MPINRVRENIDPKELIPDPENANKGTERGSHLLHESLESTGPGRAPVIDRGGKIIAGNKIAETAIELGLPVTVVQTYGEDLVIHQRLDLDLDDPKGKARRMAYLDNRSGEMNLEWDLEQMRKDDDDGVPLEEFFFPSELLEMGLEIEIDATKLPTRSTPSTGNDLEPDETPGLVEGQTYRCGNHTLTIGVRIIVGDAEVMLRAYENYTGQKAELVDDEDLF